MSGEITIAMTVPAGAGRGRQRVFATVAAADLERVLADLTGRATSVNIYEGAVPPAAPAALAAPPEQPGDAK